MLLLMIRDSSNEVAYDAFATLEELMKVEIPQMDGFVPGNFLKLKYGESISKPEEVSVYLLFLIIKTHLACGRCGICGSISEC